jgi:hypothetical protein
VEPKTWKDILNNKPNGAPEENKGHRWVPTGSKGGNKTFTRRSTFAKISFTQKVIFYKCNICGIKASKTVGLSDIVPDNNEYRNLACNEVLIKDIIQ